MTPFPTTSLGWERKIRDFAEPGVRTRTTDWTRQYRQHGFENEAPVQGERVSGKAISFAAAPSAASSVRPMKSPASTFISTLTRASAATGAS